MRKLIETKQNSLVVCDNQECDYTIPYNGTNEELVYYINKPCPKCGDNLLTKEDFIAHYYFLKIVNFLNKWFSWITIFMSKKKLDKRTLLGFHFHNGININKK